MKEYQSKKWMIREDGFVLHKCGKGFFLWYTYRPSNMFKARFATYFTIGRKCECKLRRPPSEIRKLIRLIKFMEKMKLYGTD